MEDNLRVILLDDEVLIRKLVRMKLNTAELHLDIVAEYSNANSVIEQLDEVKPDIIISDICMPGMDGISFSEQCKKILPQVKIIILTGYNDFEYARRSLKAGVCDYLMKPVQTEELNLAVEKIVRQIQDERKELELHQKMVEERDQNIPLLRNNYINKILVSDSVENDVKRMLVNYGVWSSQDEEMEIQMGIITTQEGIFNPECLIQVHSEAEAFFRDETGIYIVNDPWGRCVLLCCGENISFKACFELLIQMIKEKYEYHVGFGYCAGMTELEGIKLIYTKALEDMHITYEHQKISASQAISDYTKIIENYDVVTSIKRGNPEETLVYMKLVIPQLKIVAKHETLTTEIARSFFSFICKETGVSESSYYIENHLTWCRCEEDIIRCLESSGVDLAMQRAIGMEREKGKLIQDVITFLRDNLDNQNINVNYLASKFAVSASLLGRLFKRFTAKSYSEFISELRFWKMLELLATDAEMLDRDIGSVIGIDDPHYLCIWFKKMTGYSVGEYRKKVL